MGIYIYATSAATIKATMPSGEVLEINKSNYIGKNDDLGCSMWGGGLASTKRSAARCENHWGDDLPAAVVQGNKPYEGQVVKVPTSVVFYDDTQFDSWKAIGHLRKQGRRWVLDPTAFSYEYDHGPDANRKQWVPGTDGKGPFWKDANGHWKPLPQVETCTVTDCTEAFDTFYGNLMNGEPVGGGAL